MKDINKDHSDFKHCRAKRAAIKALLLTMILFTAMFTFACDGSSSSSSKESRGPGSTCMYDGCSAKAVGPTYEFCSKHKKALDDYWNSQRNG